MGHRGTVERYWAGCPCANCREAYADYRRAERVARYAERELIDGRLVHPRAPHGTFSGYSYWGCRCELCTEANTLRKRGVKT